MLATGLAILKIIGLILLGILGLILILVCLVLFVPVRYRLEGARDEEWKGKLQVTWLLHILSFRATYEDELNVVFRIFGFRFKDDYDSETVADAGEIGVKEVADEAADIVDAAVEPPQSFVKEPVKQQEKKHRKRREKAGRGRKKPFSFTGICDRLKKIHEEKDKLMSIINDEENRASVRLLWRQIKKLLRHILPYRTKGMIRFGFDDPYTTGQVLQYISPFYGWYSKKWKLKIIPVFEEPIFDGHVSMRGRIRIATLIMLVIPLWRNKNIRRIWKQWRG